MTYAAVLFDLFDTLVRFDRDRMPEIQVSGRTVRSTAGHLHAVLSAHAPGISLEACHEALGRLGVRAGEALFVGDRAEIDVLGAQQIGMDAAWINPDGVPLPPGIAPPRYEIRDLADLAEILEV